MSQLKGTLSFLLQLEMRIYSPAVTQEDSRGATCNLKEGLTSLRQHERFPAIIVTS